MQRIPSIPFTHIPLILTFFYTGTCYVYIHTHTHTYKFLLFAFNFFIKYIYTNVCEGEGKWEGASGWGTHVHPWLIHINVWQKPLQYYKVISLQLK